MRACTCVCVCVCVSVRACVCVFHMVSHCSFSYEYDIQLFDINVKCKSGAVDKISPVPVETKYSI